MSERAKITDVDSIRRFRASLVKFVETANVAMTDSESEILRKLGWLEGEQIAFWTGQIRKWTENVNKAKDAVRQKRIFKDSTGRQQSAFDEEKQLRRCQATLDEAEQKLINTRTSARQLQKEHLMYRGGVQRLATMLSAEMPNAVAMLDKATADLAAYMSADPTMATSVATDATTAAGPGVDGADNMKRPTEPHEDDTIEAGGEGDHNTER